MDKKEQRKYIRSILNTMTVSELNPLSYAASLNLLKLPEFSYAETILSYCAMKTECDPSYFSESAERMGKKVAYPYCVDKAHMIACVPNTPGDFSVGEYDILAPDPDNSTILEPSMIDLIIVPGMAFDKSFHRLGHGAGYYDRFLQSSNAYKVGFLFDEQLLDCVTVDEHDIAMDCIVTPTKILKNK